MLFSLSTVRCMHIHTLQFILCMNKFLSYRQKNVTYIECNFSQCRCHFIHYSCYLHFVLVSINSSLAFHSTFSSIWLIKNRLTEQNHSRCFFVSFSLRTRNFSLTIIKINVKIHLILHKKRSSKKVERNCYFKREYDLLKKENTRLQSHNDELARSREYVTF